MKRFVMIIAFPLLLAGCFGKRERVSVGEEKTIGVQEVQVAMPVNGKLVDPLHGEETWFAYGAITGKEGTPANGVIQAFFFGDGTFLYTMQINIEPAQDGSFYEAWLLNGAGDRVSAGHLGNHFGDARHQLRFEESRDLRDHATVLVTLEKDDGNPEPGEAVAEGVLKETER